VAFLQAGFGMGAITKRHFRWRNYIGMKDVFPPNIAQLQIVKAAPVLWERHDSQNVRGQFNICLTALGPACDRAAKI
jgi:hypothetical protein